MPSIFYSLFLTPPPFMPSKRPKLHHSLTPDGIIITVQGCDGTETKLMAKSADISTEQIKKLLETERGLDYVHLHSTQGKHLQQLANGDQPLLRKCNTFLALAMGEDEKAFEIEREALIAIRNAMTAHERDLPNYESTWMKLEELTTFDQFDGVTVQDGRVTNLELQRVHIYGSCPWDFALCTRRALICDF